MTDKGCPLPGAIALASLLFVSGCDSARQAIGLNKQSPDEFAVVTRAPLSQPPDFELRPPAPGQQTSRERADPISTQQLLETGQEEGENTSPASSEGEAALLGRAGASPADSKIRQIVDREASELNSVDESFVDRLLLWKRSSDPDDVVDPVAEAEQLRKKRAGTKVTGPNIERDTD